MIRTTFRTALATLSLLAALAVGTNAAYAQRPAHYYPARPPISPYLGYSNVNTTGIPSYYTTVRPTMEMYSVLRSYRTMGGFAPAAPAETRMILNEDRVADLVAERIEVRQNTGVGSVAQPATYMTYSHFYTPKSITTRAGRR